LLPEAPPSEPSTEKPRLQFGISTLLIATAALAVLLGMLRWMAVGPEAIALVMVILVASVIAAVGLAIAIAYAGDDDR
jgi:hypothetical protein